MKHCHLVLQEMLVYQYILQHHRHQQYLNLRHHLQQELKHQLLKLLKELKINLMKMCMLQLQVH